MSLLDGSGNEIKGAADEAARALEGPDFGPTPESAVIEVAAEGAEVPAFDFGEGELGEKVRKMKDMLVERNLLPNTAPPDATEGTEGVPTEVPGLKGSDVDWTEFDLDPNYAHFYPRSAFTVTGAGPKWVVVIDEYASFEKPYNGQGVDKQGNPRGLGAFITSKVNSPPDEGTGPWQVAMIVPATMGNGAILLSRKIPIVLPDPKPLVMEAKVEAPTTEELTVEDDAATKWAKEGATEGEEVTAEVEGAREVADTPEPTLADQIASEVIDGPDTE